MKGTSLAVPFVTGGLALILSDIPKYKSGNNSGEATITEVKEKIQKTSMKLPGQESPHDDRYGYGLFQAYDLYRALNN